MTSDKPNYAPYVTKIELMASINDFYSNLDNDPKFLRMCDVGSAPEDDTETDATKDSCKEITDLSTFVGTGMQVQLVSNHHIYDRLNIVVIGDNTGDGYSNELDATNISNYIMGKSKLDGVYFISSDVNDDKFVNELDATYVSNYIMGKVKTYLDIQKES